MYAFDFAGVFRGQKVEPFTGKVGVLHVVPGSFNPVHAAHRWMYESIDDESIIGRRVGGYEAVCATTSAKYFEISTSRFGKEDLTDQELLTRLRQFSGYAPVLVTTQSLFSDKYAVLKPFGEKVVFHVGMDTYERLVKASSLTEVGRLGCYFCVWPRAGVKLPGNAPLNCYSSNVEPPPHLEGLSSTKIREGLLDASGKKIST